MSKHRGRKLAVLSALVAGGLIVAVVFSDAFVEQYHLYRLRFGGAEGQLESYRKLVEMGSTRAVAPIIRQRIEAKKPTYDGLIDIAMKKPEAFAVTVQGLARQAGERAVRCFAAYLLSEIAWKSDGAASVLELLREDSDPLVKHCGDVGLQEIERKLHPPASPERLHFGIIVMESADGLVIRQVADGSPAARVDLQRGDVVEMLNDTDVDTLHNMADAVKSAAVGDILPLATRRDNESFATYLVADSRSSWSSVLPSVWRDEPGS